MPLEAHSILSIIFLVYAGAALLSTLALYARQSLLVVYLFTGMLIGPWGLGLIKDISIVQQSGDIGIIFLLFLLGLNLHPQKLVKMLKKLTVVGLVSSFSFAIAGFAVAMAFGFHFIESVIIGATMMFSSTIIGLKLLPTTVLHHQHTGEMMIGILLLQDLIAIFLLLLLHGATTHGGLSWLEIVTVTVYLPGMIVFAFAFERYVLVKLIARFDRIQEYIFLLSIAWCLVLAMCAEAVDLPGEVGAFTAGVALASSPIARFIAESLKPLRDFFLVIFFFAIGACFNMHYLPVVLLPAMVMVAVMTVVKPSVFSLLLRWTGEQQGVAKEIGFRLGQASEFSLLVAYFAGASHRSTAGIISPYASYLIQATTLLSFIVSTYWVSSRYSTPASLVQE